jgi:two-component sensor histidine kinase
MNQMTPPAAAPREIFITDELATRPVRRPDYRLEKLALQDLASRLITDPDDVLPRFVDLAMELTGGISAGLSLFESAPAPGIFRWRHLRGTLAGFENATTPRNFSPCGVTLDENRPVLARHAEKFYNWISDAKIEVPEVLLVPLYIGKDEPLGTLWIVSDEAGHFDGGDARVATELASFVGIALHMVRQRQELETALERQETLAREMSHRVKNQFSVAEGLVRLTTRTCGSKEELAESLIGRFHALADAHSLIRRSFSIDGDAPRVTDLASLLAAIMKPHEYHAGEPRFHISGPAIALGEHAINGVALAFHELATNAVKYGALKSASGQVRIFWDISNDGLALEWSEQGALLRTAPSGAEGFGSKLLTDTVKRQFGGTLQHHWEDSGLRVSIRLPVERLAN